MSIDQETNPLLMQSLGKVLAVIPARGGSKEIPRKNIRPLLGKPLLAYTIETTNEVQCLFHRIIVSTDDDQIARVARQHGGETPFIRPDHLSTDRAPMIPVLQHAVNFIEKQDGITLDWILILQPTDPLREASDIRRGFELAIAGDCDSVISVERVHAYHPIMMKKIVNNRLIPYVIEEREGTLRQNLSPPAYIRNGSIYLTKRNNLMENNSIWGRNIRPLMMMEGSRISIDTINDFKLAELLLREKGNLRREQSET